MFMTTDNNDDNFNCDDNDNCDCHYASESCRIMKSDNSDDNDDCDDNDNCDRHYVSADDNESCRMGQLCSVSGQSWSSLTTIARHRQSQNATEIWNIAKGTTDPRVEFFITNFD